MADEGRVSCSLCGKTLRGDRSRDLGICLACRRAPVGGREAAPARTDER